MVAMTGHCLCGAVRYRLSEPPASFGACHCGMCRRWTGSVLMGVQAMPGTVVWEGEENIATYKSSDWAERGWCRECGTNLFWRLTVEGPMRGRMSLAVGSLDDMAGLDFATEVFIDAKPDSYAFAGARERMTEAEVLESVGLTPEDLQ